MQLWVPSLLCVLVNVALCSSLLSLLVQTSSALPYLGRLIFSEELLLSLAESAKHGGGQLLPVLGRLFQVNVEVILQQLKSLVALVALLQLQQQVTLLPLILGLIECTLVITLVLVGATHPVLEASGGPGGVCGASASCGHYIK